MVVYATCLIVGGLLVLLSAIGGADGVDADLEVGADLDLEATVDGDGEAIASTASPGDHGIHDIDPNPQGQPRRQRIWLPFFSFKFWTFGVCFFGLTGLLISWVEPRLAAGVVAAIALLMGLFCGTLAAVVLHSLGHAQVNSLIDSDSLVGQIGVVEIPFDAHSRGKVRLHIKGSLLSFSALTQETRCFQRGDKVLVVALENNRLWVVSCDALTSTPAPPS